MTQSNAVFGKMFYISPSLVWMILQIWIELKDDRGEGLPCVMVCWVQVTRLRWATISPAIWKRSSLQIQHNEMAQHVIVSARGTHFRPFVWTRPKSQLRRCLGYSVVFSGSVEIAVLLPLLTILNTLSLYTIYVWKDSSNVYHFHVKLKFLRDCLTG